MMPDTCVPWPSSSYILEELSEVPAVNVVDIAVAVIVDTVAADFVRIGPQSVTVLNDVMSGVETGVDYGDNRAHVRGRGRCPHGGYADRRAGGHVGGLGVHRRGLDLGSRERLVNSGIGGFVENVIGFRVQHVRI